MTTTIKKLGYQASKGRRLNSGFMSIEVDDMHYCYSHDFWFNVEEQKKLLHEGKPCFYTDGYVEGRHNYYGNGAMCWNRGKGFSLKSAIRQIKKTRNLPIGTIVKIVHNQYGIGKKSRKPFSLAYTFKITEENKFDPQYEIRRPSYFRNFNTDDKAKSLTELLRANGFIVSVMSENTNFISSMLSTAASYVGKTIDETDEGGESAVAYGHGLRIGYSSNKETYNGYSNGCENILFEKEEYFNKWSQCCEISKDTPNEEILKILLNVKKETNE